MTMLATTLLPMLALFAQVFTGDSIIQWIVIAIVVAAAVGIAIVVFRQMGVQVPQFIITILWILLAAFVGIVAIRFLLRFAGVF